MFIAIFGQEGESDRFLLLSWLELQQFLLGEQFMSDYDL